jgi:hypothetical protein
LAEVAASRDLRFWEAFPVMLANAAEAGDFKYEAVKAHVNEHDKKTLAALLLMSAALYKTLGVRFKWAEEISGMFSRHLLDSYAEKLKHNEDIKIGPAVIPAGKLQANFAVYSQKTGESMKNALAVREELSLELAMARIFTAKQKELFLKKLRHEKLTKTEKEYFSRVIKKKAQALANDDLHHLARKVLE